jgi:hypothetical protein
MVSTLRDNLLRPLPIVRVARCGPRSKHALPQSESIFVICALCLTVDMQQRLTL